VRIVSKPCRLQSIRFTTGSSQTIPMKFPDEEEELDLLQDDGDDEEEEKDDAPWE